MAEDDITVEADDSDDPVEDDEEGFEARMAWVGYEDAPLLIQIGRIASLTRFASEQYEFVLGIEQHGISDDTTSFDLKIGMKDVQILSFALNLVGFFAKPEFAEHAQVLMQRIAEANDAVELTPEQEAEIDKAMEALREVAWAAALGVSVEQYRKVRQDAAEDAERAIMADSNPDSKIVLN